MKQSIVRVLLIGLIISTFMVCTVSAAATEPTTCSIVGEWTQPGGPSFGTWNYYEGGSVTYGDAPELPGFVGTGTWVSNGGGSYTTYWNFGYDELLRIMGYPNPPYYPNYIEYNTMAGDCNSYTGENNVGDSGWWIVRSAQPPVAAFTYSPSNPVVNDVLTFTSTSTDPDNTINELKYQWLLPDGSTPNTQSVSYKFLQAGTSTVKLTVTDPSGASSVTEQQITVVELKFQVLPIAANRKVVVNYPVTYDSRLILPLQALVEPAGGTYQWSIVKGADKVKIVGDAQNSAIQLQGIAPSKKPDDVELKVTYYYYSRPYSTNIKITVQKPTSIIERESANTVPYYAPLYYWYETTYHYQIMDQFNPPQPINLYTLTLTEDFTFSCTNSVLAMTGVNNEPDKYYHRTVTTQCTNGKVDDVLSPVQYLLGIPQGLTTRYSQTFDINGWDLQQTKCLNYYYLQAESTNGRCGRCSTKVMVD